MHVSPESYSQINEFNNGKLNRGLKGIVAYALYSRYLRYLRKKAYDSSDATVLLAKSFMASYLKYLRTNKADKLYAINNPVCNFRKLPEKTKKENLIINVGRLQILQKRTDKVLRFWSLFKEHEAAKDWKLEIVGNGEDMPRLQEEAVSLNLRDCAFKGYTSHPEAYYDRARIIVMTSDYEGWGLVLTEAMSFGCVPVVMNNFSSLSEIVDDGLNGIMVANDDYHSMINAVKRISADFDRFSNEAIKKSQNFKVGNIIEGWTSLFDKI